LIQSVFVILPSKDNACIFFGQIDENDEIEDLGNILGVIVEYASRLEENVIKSIRISQGKFVYGKFKNFYLITKIEQKDELEDVREILVSMANGFYEEFKEQLDNNIEDPSAYEKFSEKINDYLITKEEMKTVAPEISEEIKETDKKLSKIKKEVPTQKSSIDLLKTPEPIKLETTEVPKQEITLDGTKPLIPPMKREAYPNGIEEYMIDEVLWNESQEVMKEYTSEFVEGFVAKLKIFLSISIVHHYEVIIDFQNYPQKPILIPSETMDEVIIAKINQASYLLKNWDPKIPPHIIELVREIEKILSILKTKGELVATAELPDSMMPELEPLEELPPLTPEQEKALKEAEKVKLQTEGTEETTEITESQPMQKENPPEDNDNVATVSQPKLVTPKPIETPSKADSIEKEKKEEEKKKKKEREKKLRKEREKEKKEEEKKKKKEREKKLKKEKKEEKKMLKEIMKEAIEDGKKELKGL